MIGFEKIVEERIIQAQKKGEFDNLEGKGKPLSLEDDYHVPEDLKIAYKILKNANFLPPELEVKRQIHQTEELLANMKETKEKYKMIKKLNYLCLKYNLLHGKSIMFDEPQIYHEKLVDCFKKK